MSARPNIRFGAVTIDCAPHQVRAMVAFYSKLLNLELKNDADAAFPFLSGEGFSMNLQPEAGYQPPTWPEGERGQQIHLDLLVDDLAATTAYCLSIGATESPVQYGSNWHILLDPAGHPFCLCVYDD